MGQQRMSNLQRRATRHIRKLMWSLLRRRGVDLTLNTLQGRYRIPTDCNDPISRQLFIYRQFELDLVNEAMPLIREVMGFQKGRGVLIDIGANNGVISIGMMLAQEMARAVAIEPEPRNFGHLTTNVALNGLQDRISCLHCAASSESTLLTLELSSSNYGDHRIRSRTADSVADLMEESRRPVIQVPAEPLDEIVGRLGLPDNEELVLWVDVQGFEGHVFQGAEGLLSRGLPVVSEIWPYGIVRAGTSREQFCALVRRHWPWYWVRRRHGFVKYPTQVFDTLFDELGMGRDQCNVIFTP